MENIATTSEIKSLIVDVSEKINQKNLLDFAHTTLDINNIEYTDTDIIYCNFLEYSKQYQFFIFSNNFKYMIIELLNNLDVKSKHSKELKTFSLYITRTFFVIYKNDKLYTYQTINQEYTKDELLSFINKSFNITITKIYELKDSELKKITENIEERRVINSLLNINKKTTKNFVIYLSYLFLCILSMLVYLSYESKNLENDKLKKMDTAKKEYSEISKILKFKPFRSEYEKLISTTKKFKLKIVSINYNNDSINIKLSTKNKDNIYLFLNDYEDNLLGNSIVKHDTKNIFDSIVNVKIN